MRKNQKGFGLIEILIALVLVVVVGGGAWYIWSRRQTGTGGHSAVTQFAGREYRVYLDAATDDRLINYYKLGVNITLENSNAGAVDPGSGGPGPCQEVVEDYAVDKSYKGNTVLVKIVNYKRIENPKGIPDNDPKCKELDSRGVRTFDLDKRWLYKSGKKTVKVEGLDDSKFTLSAKNFKLTLTKADKTLSTLAFYPDNVAVLSAAGVDCPANSKELLTSRAKEKRLPLADPRYPGLDSLYRRPQRELHVILNRLIDIDVRRLSRDLDGDCAISVSKPNLHDLR
jgi:prepilin-type N-terminal cleavage/methylation domain-containing protein